jgi:glycerol uptake facilitator-like aquaporin
MVGNWIFQFMGAFLAASVYKIICRLEMTEIW